MQAERNFAERGSGLLLFQEVEIMLKSYKSVRKIVMPACGPLSKIIKGKNNKVKKESIQRQTPAIYLILATLLSLESRKNWKKSVTR